MGSFVTFVTFLILFSLKKDEKRDARGRQIFLCPASTQEIPRKTPRKRGAQFVHIGADMGQMRTPIWIFRTLLTNVQTLLGLVIRALRSLGLWQFAVRLRLGFVVSGNPEDRVRNRYSSPRWAVDIDSSGHTSKRTIGFPLRTRSAWSTRLQGHRLM
jgi:hypothetical protein